MCWILLPRCQRGGVHWWKQWKEGGGCLLVGEKEEGFHVRRQEGGEGPLERRMVCSGGRRVSQNVYVCTYMDINVISVDAHGVYNIYMSI